MSRDVSDTFKSEVFNQEMADVAIVLITISHVDISDNILVSSDSTEALPILGVPGTVSNGLEYPQFPFELTLQEQSDNLLARATLKIDNVSREIIQAIRSASNDPPTVRIQIVLSSDTDTPEIDIQNLQLNNIKANASYVEGELQPKIIQGEKFPSSTFNQADFPGVFGG